jgi:hypothetical protein
LQTLIDQHWLFLIDIRVPFQGYLVLDSFFKQEELDPGKIAINELVDQLATLLYEHGKITGKAGFLPFFILIAIFKRGISLLHTLVCN